MKNNNAIEIEQNERLFRQQQYTKSNNNAEAKIAGITPAWFIFNGKWDDSPPYILFPIWRLG